MKLRGACRFGGFTYYQLIASAFEGSPVQPGDATIHHGNSTRDMRLVLNNQHRIPNGPTPEDHTAHAQQSPAAELEGASGRG